VDGVHQGAFSFE
jgi:transporter family-2 protein